MIAPAARWGAAQLSRDVCLSTKPWAGQPLIKENRCGAWKITGALLDFERTEDHFTNHGVMMSQDSALFSVRRPREVSALCPKYTFNRLLLSRAKRAQYDADR